MLKIRLHFLLFLMLTVIVFGNSLFFDFVWDDTIFVVGQSNYQHFDFGKIFLSPANGVEYLPVRDFTYLIDYYLWGWNPVGFHLTNVAFYFLNLIFIYLMTLKISRYLLPSNSSEEDRTDKFIALFTTFFFAVNPQHSEPVSFIMCRNVLVSGLFFFMSCYFYLTFLFEEKYRYYTIALLSFILALFSKATAIILPGILLLLLFHARRFRLKNLLWLIPFIILAGAGHLIFTSIATQSGIINKENVIVFGSFNLMSKIAISLQIPQFYLKKLLVPLNLSTEYYVKFSRELLSLQTIIAAGTLSLIIILGIALKKKYPQVLFAISWFLICLIPALNFFLTNPVVADRYVFLSSYAFAYLLAVLMYYYSRRKSLRLILVSALLVIIFYSSVSFTRNLVWKSEESVMSDMIISSPENPKGYINLGKHYFEEKNYRRAFELFTKLQEIDPANKILEYYSARLDFSEGRSVEAIQKLKYVVSVSPHNTMAWHLLGKIYESNGQIDLSIDCYKKVLKSPESLVKLKHQAEKRLIALRKKIDIRFSRLQKQIQSNPRDFYARMQLATAFQRAGLNDRALAQYKEILKSNHFNWQVHYNMGLIYSEDELNENAVEQFKKCLSLNDTFVRALNDLGLVYKKLNKYDLAIDAFKKAISIDKNYRHPIFNLARLYFQLGDRENSLKYFNILRKDFPDLIPMTVNYYKYLNG